MWCCRATVKVAPCVQAAGRKGLANANPATTELAVAEPVSLPRLRLRAVHPWKRSDSRQTGEGQRNVSRLVPSQRPSPTYGVVARLWLTCSLGGSPEAGGGVVVVWCRCLRRRMVLCQATLRMATSVVQSSCMHWLIGKIALSLSDPLVSPFDNLGENISNHRSNSNRPVSKRSQSDWPPHRFSPRACVRVSALWRTACPRHWRTRQSGRARHGPSTTRVPMPSVCAPSPSRPRTPLPRDSCGPAGEVAGSNESGLRRADFEFLHSASSELHAKPTCRSCHPYHARNRTRAAGERGVQKREGRVQASISPQAPAPQAIPPPAPRCSRSSARMTASARAAR